jgi:hypothetical protein
LDVEGLSGEALAGAAQIWKRQRRTLTARFGGTSMRPTLDAGAELTFVCGDVVAVGDVAVLVCGGRILVHRLVARGETGWLLTRGDATWVPDPPSRDEDVVGRVVAVGTGAEGRAPASEPRSAGRRVLLLLCIATLRVSEGAGRRSIALLWRLRALARKLRGLLAPHQQQ